MLELVLLHVSWYISSSVVLVFLVMVSSAGITTSSSTSILTSSRAVTTEEQPIFLPALKSLIQSVVVDVSWHGPPTSTVSAATSMVVSLSMWNNTTG